VLNVLAGNVGIGSEVILAVLMMKMGAFTCGVTTKMAGSLGCGGWVVAGASRSEVISLMLSATVKFLSGYTSSS
jgi:hypothetical protein